MMSSNGLRTLSAEVEFGWLLLCDINDAFMVQRVELYPRHNGKYQILVTGYLRSRRNVKIHSQPLEEIPHSCCGIHVARAISQLKQLWLEQNRERGFAKLLDCPAAMPAMVM
jgi:hypothetical protein